MSLTNSANWMYSSGGVFYDYEIEQSARMTSDNSSYLQRTPSTSGNRDTWTFSCWMKRTELNGGGERIFGAGDDLVSPGNHNNTITLYFDNHKLRFRQESGGSAQMDLLSNAVYRDTSAWYHIMCVYDSTNGTSGDRARMYVNGERITSLSINDPDPGSGTDSNCMRAGHIMRIGRSTSGYHNHNLAEVHWVDGSALEPTSFGETKSGVWIPKEYSGSYGTNGVYLKFANSAAFGTDSSGNGNTFSTGGLATHDQLPDSPTNNFGGWMSEAGNESSGFAYSEGSKKIVAGSGDYGAYGNFFTPKSGKWYWEYCNTAVSAVPSYKVLGIASASIVGGNDKYDPSIASGVEWGPTGGTAAIYSIRANGDKLSISATTTYGADDYETSNDIVQVALDMDNLKVWFGINGVWQNSGDPVAGTNAAFTSIAEDYYTCMIHQWYPGQGASVNFGDDGTFHGSVAAGGNADANGIGDFKYAPPSGFLALCSANLPQGAIDTLNDETPEDYFDTILYTAASTNGTYTHGSLSFRPDFTWIKNRNNVERHFVIDVLRGNTSITDKYIVTSSSAAEGVNNTTGTTFSVTDTGYQFVETTINSDELYFNSRTYVGWNWKAGGAGVSNSDGSITTTVSVGATSQQNWFSIVKYTGNDSGTIGHGLGVTPDFFIIKNLDNGSYNWNAWHNNFTSRQVMYPNLTNARNDDPNVWNNTLPTSTVISVDNVEVNNSGDEHIAYCFANAEGLCKVGDYVGNGSTDGTFLYTGFRPALWIVKAVISGEPWMIMDNKRDAFNLNDAQLQAQDSRAESNDGNGIDFLSNGIKMRSNIGNWNTNGVEYIYMAIAEQPFKYANAR